MHDQAIVDLLAVRIVTVKIMLLTPKHMIMTRTKGVQRVNQLLNMSGNPTIWILLKTQPLQRASLQRGEKAEINIFTMNCVTSLPGSAGMWHDTFSVGCSCSTYRYLKTTQKNNVTSSSFGQTLRKKMKDDGGGTRSREKNKRAALMLEMSCDLESVTEHHGRLWSRCLGLSVCFPSHSGWDTLVSFTESDLHLYFIQIPAALQRKQM